MLRMDELDEEKRTRYLGLIDSSADELAELLDLLSLAARIEGGRYEPVVREADSLALAPEGAVRQRRRRPRRPGAGRAGARLARSAQRPATAASRSPSAVDGPRVSFEPVTAEAAPVALGEDAQGSRRRRSPSVSCARSVARWCSTASA